MERLTIKNNDGSYSQPTHTTFNKLFEKLSKLEDVLEKYGIESVEELNERLGNAIVPRFNIGQEVWVVLDDGVAKDVVENNWFLCSLEKSRLGLYEDYLFATEEEAIKRLEELKGE